MTGVSSSSLLFALTRSVHADFNRPDPHSAPVRAGVANADQFAEAQAAIALTQQIQPIPKQRSARFFLSSLLGAVKPDDISLTWKWLVARNSPPPPDSAFPTEPST